MIFQPLNLPPAPLRLRKLEEKHQVFDPVRKKWIILTPEEWVRQHILHFLETEKQYSINLMGVEKTILVNGLKKRCDIIIFDRQGQGQVLVECKAPDVELTQTTFDQIARYNLRLEIPILLVTNGLQHYCCRMNHDEQRYDFLKNIPDVSEIKTFLK